MPLVYADEDVASTVMGWHGTYAEVMGMGEQEEYITRALAPGYIGQARPTRATWRHRRDDFMYTEPSPQVGRLYEAGMGANLWERLGLKSPLSRYEGKGMSPMQIFARFRAVHMQANQRIASIPRGSVQEVLRKQSAKLEILRTKLEPVFSAGAKMGSKDRDNLERYVEGVKSLRSAVNAQVKTYGLRAVPDEYSVSPADIKEATPSEGFSPLLLLIPAAVALVLK
jgi:hypothetical protein